eukprot:m.52749 g.52749  ORF g.52749 m.52749 type:complete len:637 (+) comp11333_c0_seq1:92-2002(+)
MDVSPFAHQQGYLTKRGDKNKFSYKTRYFVRRENMLEYYTDSSCLRWVGRLSLTGSTVQLSARKSKARPFGFDIVTPHRVWHLFAPSKEALELWQLWLTEKASNNCTQQLQSAENLIELLALQRKSCEEVHLVIPKLPEGLREGNDRCVRRASVSSFLGPRLDTDSFDLTSTHRARQHATISDKFKRHVAQPLTGLFRHKAPRTTEGAQFHPTVCVMHDDDIYGSIDLARRRAQETYRRHVQMPARTMSGTSDMSQVSSVASTATSQASRLHPHLSPLPDSPSSSSHIQPEQKHSRSGLSNTPASSPTNSSSQSQSSSSAHFSHHRPQSHIVSDSHRQLSHPTGNPSLLRQAAFVEPEELSSDDDQSIHDTIQLVPEPPQRRGSGSSFSSYDEVSEGSDVDIDDAATSQTSVATFAAPTPRRQQQNTTQKPSEASGRLIQRSSQSAFSSQSMKRHRWARTYLQGLDREMKALGQWQSPSDKQPHRLPWGSIDLGDDPPSLGRVQSSPADSPSTMPSKALEAPPSPSSHATMARNITRIKHMSAPPSTWLGDTLVEQSVDSDSDATEQRPSRQTQGYEGTWSPEIKGKHQPSTFGVQDNVINQEDSVVDDGAVFLPVPQPYLVFDDLDDDFDGDAAC